MMYSTALIGCGWMGIGAELDVLRLKPASHAEAIAANKKTKLAALVDSNPKSLRLARKLYPDVPRFTDPAEMLERIQPDIVVIATPPESHAELVGLAARQRVRAILSEKPISDNLTKAREAVLACRKSGSLLLVNHMRRFDPVVRQYRDYIRDGYIRDTFIGPVRSAIAYYDRGLYHGGTHFIDLLRFFLGEVRWVSAVRNHAFSNVNNDIAADAFLGFDHATAALQYFDSREYALSEVSFFGTRGRLNLCHMSGLEVEVVGTRSCTDYSSYRELDYSNVRRVAPPRSFQGPNIQHIVDCLENRDTPVSTGEDALKTLEVIRAMQASVAKNGMRIALKKARNT